MAVLGPVVAACSSDPAPSPTSGTPGPAGSSSTTGSGESASSVVDPGDLRWERVNLGFVSAYVLARGTEVAIVDTGTAGSGPQIAEALGALSATWDDVDHVIVTHAHPDHVGSLSEVLDSAASATGYVGIGDIEQLSSPLGLVGVSDGDEVFGLQVIGTPGHTPGHISVLDPESGLLVAGDAMVVDGGALAGPDPEFTEDLDTAHASVQALATETVNTILVGHGDPVTAGAGQQLSDLAASL